MLADADADANALMAERPNSPSSNRALFCSEPCGWILLPRSATTQAVISGGLIHFIDSPKERYASLDMGFQGSFTFMRDAGVERGRA